MNLPHDEITHDEITHNEITSQWIYLTMRLPKMKLLTGNLPHDEITTMKLPPIFRAEFSPWEL